MHPLNLWPFLHHTCALLLWSAWFLTHNLLQRVCESWAPPGGHRVVLQTCMKIVLLFLNRFYNQKSEVADLVECAEIIVMDLILSTQIREVRAQG